MPSGVARLVRTPTLSSPAFWCLLLNWCWQTCHSFAPIFASPGSSFFWNIQGYFMLVTCLAAVLLWKRLETLLAWHGLVPVTLVLMEFATLSYIALATFFGETPMAMWYAIAGGCNTVGSFLMVLICIKLIADHAEESERLTIVVFAVVAKLLLYLVVDNLPASAGYAATALMPLAFAYFARQGFSRADDTGRHSSETREKDSLPDIQSPAWDLERRSGIPALTLVLLAVMPFCIEYMREAVRSQGADMPFASNSELIAVSLFIVALVAVLELKSIASRKASIIPLAVSVLLAVGFALAEAGIAVEIALAMMYACFFLYRTVLYRILANYSALRPESLVCVFVVGMACDAIGHTLSLLLWTATSDLLASTSAASSAIIYLVAVSSVVMFQTLQQRDVSLAGAMNKKGTGTRMGKNSNTSEQTNELAHSNVSHTPGIGSNAGGDMTSPTPISLRDALEQDVDLVASQYDLTSRERDVLVLIITNKSYTQIAEAFDISANTVKSHQKHLYQKLGIHSAEELFPLLEEVDRVRTGMQE